jgi:hypothetical protein
LIVRRRRLFRFGLASGASSLANSVSAAPSASEWRQQLRVARSLAAFGLYPGCWRPVLQTAVRRMMATPALPQWLSLYQTAR